MRPKSGPFYRLLKWHRPSVYEREQVCFRFMKTFYYMVEILLNVLHFCYFYLQEMVNALREELVTKGSSLDEVKKAVKEVSTLIFHNKT